MFGFRLCLVDCRPIYQNRDVQKHLIVGAELQSIGLDMTDRGRGVSVIFGDGAGAAVVSRSEEEGVGTCRRTCIQKANMPRNLRLAPGMGGRWVTDILSENDPEDVSYFPYMNGQFVFKNAVQRFSEVIHEGLRRITCR
jgi:3-oxoacyl-[acyl-carrier-protein] synthase-3